MVWDLCAWWIEPHTDGKRHCFIWKRSKENSPIYCSIENNKILRNKFNQRGEGSLHWRLQDIDERRRCKQMERYPIFTAMVFPCSHVQMWELDQKEGWVPKYCRFQFVVLKTLESPLNSKEIKPVNSKGNQPWIFTGRTDAEAEAAVLWPPDAKSWLIRKDPDAGKDWRQEEKGIAEDEMIGWYHQFDGHEFEQAPGVGDGQRSLECHSPWSHIESDMTEQLNWSLCKKELRKPTLLSF